CRKCRVKLSIVGNVEDAHGLPELFSGGLHVADLGLRLRTGRVHQHSNERGSGDGVSTSAKMLMPVSLEVGRRKLVTRPRSMGSVPTWNMIGMVLVAAFAASAAGGPNAAITLT